MGYNWIHFTGSPGRLAIISKSYTHFTVIMVTVQCLNVSIRDRNLPAAFVELRLLRGRPLCPRPDLLSANEGTPVVASTPREHSQWSWQTGAEGNSVSHDDCCGVLNSQKIHGTVRNKHMAKALQSAQFSEPSAVWHPGEATEGRVQPCMDKQTHACPAVTH